MSTAVVSTSTSQATVSTTTRQVTVTSTGSPGRPGIEWDNDGWITDTAYALDTGLYHNGSSYRAIAAHTSSTATEPGVGADWATAWKMVAGKGQDALPEDIADSVDELYTASPAKVIGSAALSAAITPQALAIATGEVAIDLSTGQNFTLDADESYTLLLPTNCFAGQTFEIDITNSATVVPAFESGYVGPDDALPSLPTESGETVTLSGKVMAATGGAATVVRIVEIGRNWGDGT